MQDITEFNAAGGCSCKLPAEQLESILDFGAALQHKSPEAADDAAFSTLPSGDILASSIDFQNPIVANARHAGHIGALNALSDIFACGVQPSAAEVVLAVPQIDRDAQVQMGRDLMDGIKEACQISGCEIVGGHTVVLQSPIVGLAVRGVAPPHQIKRKSGALPGDLLVMTKPLGSGIAVAARQSGFLGDSAWHSALEVMMTPNVVGRVFGEHESVTSLTDITGFGLLGHAVEVGKASGVCLDIETQSVPLLPGIKRSAVSGYAPLLAQSNWDFAASTTAGAASLSEAERIIFSDPQTNGGLLASVRPDEIDTVIAACLEAGHSATLVGRVTQYDGNFCGLRKA